MYALGFLVRDLFFLYIQVPSPNTVTIFYQRHPSPLRRALVLRLCCNGCHCAASFVAPSWHPCIPLLSKIVLLFCDLGVRRVPRAAPLWSPPYHCSATRIPNPPPILLSLCPEFCVFSLLLCSPHVSRELKIRKIIDTTEYCIDHTVPRMVPTGHSGPVSVESWFGIVHFASIQGQIHFICANFSFERFTPDLLCSHHLFDINRFYSRHDVQNIIN